MGSLGIRGEAGGRVKGYPLRVLLVIEANVDAEIPGQNGANMTVAGAAAVRYHLTIWLVTLDGYYDFDFELDI